MKKRKEIIRKNIELCFPHLGEKEQRRLQHSNMQELGVGALDFFSLLVKSNSYVEKQAEIKGFSLLRDAVEAKQGVIILLPHTATMCMAIGVLSQLFQISVLHRPFKNETLRHILDKIIRKLGLNLVAQRDTKEMLKVLKNKGNLVILPDHDMGRGIFADFFGIKAATTVSVFKLAKSTGAKIISAYSYRMSSGKVGIELSDGLNYCDKYDEAATAMNAYIEDNVKRFPAQYYWPHRRFKTRPKNESNIY